MNDGRTAFMHVRKILRGDTMKKLIIAAGLALAVSPCLLHGQYTEMEYIKTGKMYPVEAIDGSGVKSYLKNLLATRGHELSKLGIPGKAGEDKLKQIIATGVSLRIQPTALRLAMNELEYELAHKSTRGAGYFPTNLARVYEKANRVAAIVNFMDAALLATSIKNSARDFVNALITIKASMEARKIYNEDKYRYAIERVLRALENKAIFERVYKNTAEAKNYLKLLREFNVLPTAAVAAPVALPAPVKGTVVEVAPKAPAIPQGGFDIKKQPVKKPVVHQVPAQKVPLEKQLQQRKQALVKVPEAQKGAFGKEAYAKQALEEKEKKEAAIKKQAAEKQKREEFRKGAEESVKEQEEKQAGEKFE